MIINQEITFTSSFGGSRTGDTVTVDVLDTSGNVVGSGFTAQSVIELSDGFYAVTITFTVPISGYLKWNNVTESLIIYQPIVVSNDDLNVIRKIETNRWKISNNQLVIYDDDGTTVYKTFNLFLNGVANGDAPNERVPV